MSEAAHRWCEIEQICEAALARPAVDRDAFLRGACGDDADLRQQVDAVIAQAARAERFLEQPVAAVSALLLDPVPDAVLTGSQVGTLTIGPLIGSGGMGRVFRARDAELDREVAVKLLLPEHADDADRLARFAREARVLASLNHRNIAQIHGVTPLAGGTAIVMELVDGETLAERIAGGACALSDALPIARQIAEALEAAHAQGIVHRDLKPANIKVAPDGTVKVLDFGLAKSLRPGALAAANHRSGDRSTIPGLVLGTAAYMAPEQVRAIPVDRRADLWALGCVLFEMLTGQAAFGGETPSDVMVRIIDHAPDWDALPAATPPAIGRLLRRCLEKDAAHRLDSAAVARLEIDDAEAELNEVAAASEASAGRGWRPLRWASGGAVAGAILTLALLPLDRSASGPAVVATTVTVRDLGVAMPGVHFAVSPNGQSVVFSGRYAGQSVLLRRDLDRIEPVPIPGTAGGSDVFFSPDGLSIGFETASELWTAPLEGGAPRRLMPNVPLRGAAWGADARIVVGRVGSGLWIVPAAGGEPVQLTIPDAGTRHELPQLLPGSVAVLFTILSAKAPTHAAVLSLETGEIRELVEGSGARFVNPGHLLFGRQGRLWAVAFDPVSLRTRGSARPVLDDVLWSPAGYPQFSMNAGLLAYIRSSNASPNLGKVKLAVADRRGEMSALPLPADNYLLPRLSPAGDKLVVQVGATRDLWAYDLRRGTFTRLTSGRVVAFSAPAWTSDGRRVVFTTWFGKDVGLASLPADGSGPVEALVHLAGMRSFERTHPALLPDGSAAILTGLAPGAVVEDLLVVGLQQEPRLETLVRESAVERNAAVASNGRFIAYNSDESGRPEVYVRPLAEVGGRRWQISTDGGAFPMWTRGGRELIYKDEQGRIMTTAVAPNNAGELDVSKPAPLFTVAGGIGLGLDRGFDVTADGERFLFVVEGADAASAATVELVLLQNWVTELARLVPR